MPLCDDFLESKKCKHKPYTYLIDHISTYFCSPAGRRHSAVGLIHIAVRSPVSVRVGHRVPGSHRDMRPVARTQLRPLQLRTHQGHHIDHHRHPGPGAGHVHQLAGHRPQVVARIRHLIFILF